tara:strand:- start:102 stop:419 length:318 start_codon:yes stop_codon:yes gene_type:complete
MTSPNPEVEFHLDGFLEQCNEILKEHYETKFPTLGIPEIKVYPGGKYYKVAKKDGSQNNESVWFFVDKEEGNIWKPAGWKAPAKNFPRGNILTDNAKDVIGVYGL